MNQNCDDKCDPSALRMKFAEDNPELIAKIFEGDPLAFEAFTNHGGIRGKVTQVVITDAVKMQTKLYFFWQRGQKCEERAPKVMRLIGVPQRGQGSPSCP